MALRFLLMLVFVLSFSGCTDILQPPVESVDINMVPNGSFESDGSPSLNGWICQFFADPAFADSISFSSDVPPSGGSWSLRIPSNETRMSVAVILPAPLPSAYRLTLWAKVTEGGGSLSNATEADFALGASEDGPFFGTGQSITDSLWREINVELDSARVSAIPDSLRHLIVSLQVDRDVLSNPVAYFDLVRIHPIPQSEIDTTKQPRTR